VEAEEGLLLRGAKVKGTVRVTSYFASVSQTGLSSYMLRQWTRLEAVYSTEVHDDRKTETNDEVLLRVAEVPWVLQSLRFKFKASG